MKNTMNTLQTWKYSLSGSLCLLVSMTIGFSATMAYGGPYADSAHGNTTAGVIRSDITAAGYSRGNCAHCHEKHASIEGDEPAPDNDSPSPFLLFTDNFDTSVTGYPYTEPDNICFSCHNDAGSIMQVTNNNYAQTFGGFTPTTPIDSILDAFTPLGATHSEHNLKDVYNYAKDTFSYFTDSSNPCAACHNPHLAKRNKTDPDNPALTVISRPTDHNNLWGDGAGETMADYAGANTYLPPYYWNSATTYEPDGSALHDGSKIPDYNTFCLDCHQFEVPSTNTSSANPFTTHGFLTAIDWSGTGDMHGQKARIWDVNGTGNPNAGTIIAPYNQGTPSSNYVLSCLDCHEPHGTVLIGNSYLLRKVINNNQVTGCGGGETDWCQNVLCQSCHANAHCGGPQGCFSCHHHGAVNKGCGGPYTGPNF